MPRGYRCSHSRFFSSVTASRFCCPRPLLPKLPERVLVPVADSRSIGVQARGEKTACSCSMLILHFAHHAFLGTVVVQNCIGYRMARERKPESAPYPKAIVVDLVDVLLEKLSNVSLVLHISS